MSIVDKVLNLARDDSGLFSAEFIPVLDHELYLRVFDTDTCRVVTVSEVCEMCEYWAESLAKPDVMSRADVKDLRKELIEVIKIERNKSNKTLLHYENLALVHRQRWIDMMRSS